MISASFSCLSIHFSTWFLLRLAVSPCTWYMISASFSCFLRAGMKELKEEIKDIIGSGHCVAIKMCLGTKVAHGSRLLVHVDWPCPRKYHKHTCTVDGAKPVALTAMWEPIFMSLWITITGTACWFINSPLVQIHACACLVVITNG